MNPPKMPVHIGEYKLPPEKLVYEAETAWERRRIRIARARRKGTHTPKEWNELRDRIGCCVCCGATGVRLSKDHIVAISVGGCDCIHNLQPLCDPCNSRKGNQ
jgi:5-methylcytosine-specific restriction endonuclease McrA